jgi:hypothetical protein
LAIPKTVLTGLNHFSPKAYGLRHFCLCLALLPQLGLDFHKNKTFCVFNPLIFRTGIFRSAAKAPVVPT